MVSPTVVKIAELNDKFRRCDSSVPGMRFLTAGIIELLKRSNVDGDEIIKIVSEFNVFTEGNDPHGEHDFGTFEYLGETCFWKIDAYDNDYSMGSDDPTDLSRTKRILTVMLADEW
ncbi:DUF3768 domain-containing protein [Sulfitobacter sp. M57]|uniref:DUF3768 domain-containing protein n=1 Tax=unclassified Sulfitobacter TaxID=196795 RepID=UPI0023E14DF6|nr:MULTISPECIES: DUF3768 domain-containing protein [unclassified Sulfitobacter]MDF3415787.1 DUF3768 domain-containing protein [Sulfitobacter sp. KE5]MDF3423267.1 DUF3768 domain-containing protein [Sulfitobacter sp. KE43]MDF3434333.1 DUF3768 domain-containing protein [Sulfitobacter sp. KE42]MDF3459634.1 DUF3768 domain-containing protein [Sulfitobacter sp. S74]MDF3463871.1 DUF3768 domain-containing protein [Sulfitobacter sp. Ks18]